MLLHPAFSGESVHCDQGGGGLTRVGQVSQELVSFALPIFGDYLLHRNKLKNKKRLSVETSETSSYEEKSIIIIHYSPFLDGGK